MSRANVIRANGGNIYRAEERVALTVTIKEATGGGLQHESTVLFTDWSEFREWLVSTGLRGETP